MFDGKAMRRIREEREMSRSGLAEKLGRSQLTVRRWETGRTKPNSHSVAVLAGILQCNVDEITAGVAQ
ncbi:helix-turn-helix domain-containing protein [Streptomyces sp. XY511]|uniref:helix-turn-helix domain-containing protein n=1 Tax=Streptomyces sp. XY511 TaxID=1519480 RepID=UPI00099DC038|nr:helix-turn-helix transcriptional regulator [Streptomyces sp. XY511]